MPSTLNTAASILLVEDDSEIARLLGMLLSSEGYAFQHIARGDQAVEAIQDMQPDIVLLDVMLPGMNGVDVCRAVRSFYQGAILMLTACEDDITEIAALNVGADDYLVKPVRPHVLLARLNSLLRRVSNASLSAETPAAPSHIQCDSLLIDLQNRQVSLDDDIIELTTAEYELLAFLAAKPGQIVSRDECFQSLRGIEYDGIDRSMDMRLSVLRKKLNAKGCHPDLIKTIRGKGYLLTTQQS